MNQVAQEPLSTIAGRETWTVEDYRELVRQLPAFGEPTAKLRGMLSQFQAGEPELKGAQALKVGIVQYMLCRFQEALQTLANATDNRDRHYFQALCSKNLRQYDKAQDHLERARSRGWDDTDTDLQLVEVRALAGDLAGADKILRKYEGKLETNPDYFYLRGLLDELSGRREQAVAAYERARSIEPGHPAATFRLAYYYDLHGQESQAIDLYKECVSRPVVHVNALLNMAVLYEDAGQIDKAVACLWTVLAASPHHARARLFLRDAQAAQTMYYDEDQAKRIARRNAVLDIPVTDFELSVRARNCLKKMNIRTLGDLVRTSEPDLLSYKNFGETSLREIREMLTAKGLCLGQPMEEPGEFASGPAPAPNRSPEEGLLATPVEHVEFSIRVRRALQVLKVATLGDLASKTEPELLGCKNFGQTSLNEVKQRLAEYGLQLREQS